MITKPIILFAVCGILVSCNNNEDVWKDIKELKKNYTSQEEAISVILIDSNLHFVVDKSELENVPSQIWLSILLQDDEGYIFSTSDYFVFSYDDIVSKKAYLFQGKTSTEKISTVPTSIIKRLRRQSSEVNVFCKIKLVFDDKSQINKINHFNIKLDQDQ